MPSDPSRTVEMDEDGMDKDELDRALSATTGAAGDSAAVVGSSTT